MTASPEYVEVALIVDVPLGAIRMVQIGIKSIVLVNVGGEFYAVGGACTHARCSLAAGWLEEYRLVCPCHFTEYDARTGQQVKWAYGGPLATFPVKRIGGALFVMA